MEIEKEIAAGGPKGRKPIYLGYWVLVTIIFLYDRTYLITKAGLPYFFVCSIVRIALLVASPGLI